ncbi:MAG: LysR substrate-binding domain-containing protein [Synechococcaceae cyanobacterium]|nr:LysR substrate-binding domain-containing protein [Synechococcaceae cyanobacterium]
MAVIDQDTLAALDGLQWLRTGEAVENCFGFHTATVSRHSRRCLERFGLKLRREQGEWCLAGDSTLLQMERRVHQAARWLAHRPLRLEATYWSGPLLCVPTPSRWLLGDSSIVGVQRNFQLVRERIVDVFLAGLPDLPARDDPDLAALLLCSMPVFYVAAADHPLSRVASLSVDEIARFPSLALPSGSYPLVESALKTLGLWNDPVRMGRYRRELWEGRAEEELVIGYGTPLSLEVSGGALVRLPLELPFRSGEALVVRREFAEHDDLLSLRKRLLERLRSLSLRHPELEVLPQ